MGYIQPTLGVCTAVYHAAFIASRAAHLPCLHSDHTVLYAPLSHLCLPNSSRPTHTCCCFLLLLRVSSFLQEPGLWQCVSLPAAPHSRPLQGSIQQHDPAEDYLRDDHPGLQPETVPAAMALLGLMFRLLSVGATAGQLQSAHVVRLPLKIDGMIGAPESGATVGPRAAWPSNHDFM